MAKLQAPVPAEHLQAIGQITVNFALLESEISFFVWTWVSKDQRLGQIITAELSFRNLVSLLSSIFRHTVSEADKITELEELLGKALMVEEKRNVITHSVWAAGNTPETITRIKTTAKKSKGLRHQFEQMSVDDLNKIAEQIAELAQEIRMFLLRQLESNPNK